MVYLITYQSNDEHHTVKWIAPESWSTATVSQQFCRQFPAAQIISIKPRQ